MSRMYTKESSSFVQKDSHINKVQELAFRVNSSSGRRYFSISAMENSRHLGVFWIVR